MKTIFFILTICIALLFVPISVSAQSMEAMRQEGIASWYGPEFNGRPTASGEIFNSALLTAAHPTLPFGTIVLVTNRHNNRQVTVRINDRGPFVAGRIIDVSRAAAEQLEMLITGTAPVVVDVIQSAGQHGQAVIPPVYVQQPLVQPPAQPMHPGFNLPPVQQQPTIQTQQPVQPPVQQPLPVHPPVMPLPPIQQPPPPQPTLQHPQVTVTPGPSDTAAQGPYAPITVTIFPPTQPAQPPAAPVPLPPLQQEIPQTFALPQTIPEALPPSSISGARLIPPMNPAPDKTYTMQIGSFRVARNAVDTFTALRNAGLNPEYERHNDFYRVVLKGIRGTDVQSVADRIEMAGFREAIIREE
ncbi:MAG: septal ring lytic transglycosylase RlpA family protein [Treponema sp.]|nr:septal ring lytic transglycosylase RlpA family protein [Treponema sp.]